MAREGAGRRVLITGAASGIGAACAAVLADAGMPLVLTDIAEPTASPPPNAPWIQADLTSDTDRARLLDATGPLAGLVHSAGILRVGDPATLAPDVWDAVINVNLTATFRLVQAALSQLCADASIVLLSSVSAKWAATPESIAYAASKAAILSLTRSFATYLAPRGIRVNAICPGIIDTPMQQNLLRQVAAARGLAAEQLDAERNTTIPLGRKGDPAEVAQVAAFLISSASSYMTGQSINVTGGMVTH